MQILENINRIFYNFIKKTKIIYSNQKDTLQHFQIPHPQIK